jgi:formate dehydrogenase subunit gamma
MRNGGWRRWSWAVLAAAALTVAGDGLTGAGGSLGLAAPSAAQTGQPQVGQPPGGPIPGGQVPSGALGTISDAEVWRAIRQGVSGTVSIPDKKAAVLVQSEGDNWRGWRNGPIAVAGAIAFWVMFFVIFGFYMIRGRVEVQHGLSGRKILRFRFIERFAHWLTAGSFILLAVTGVNMLYGKHVLIPLLGKSTFAALTQFGKYLHNYVAFAFMVGLVLMFVLWVRDNLLDRYDWGWIKKGGGLLFPTDHPPAAKFNFGQKTVFWAVMVSGLLLSVTGLNLMFPFYAADLHQMQWIQAVHATVSQVICMMMIAHIYIGSIGMQGAFEAMSTGEVDENWAKEHHSAWHEEAVREQQRQDQADTGGVHRPLPAE